MNERILKRISLISVKKLQQEKLLQYYIENGWEYHEDIIGINAKIFCYKSDIEQLRRHLNKQGQFVFNNQF